MPCRLGVTAVLWKIGKWRHEKTTLLPTGVVCLFYLIIPWLPASVELDQKILCSALLNKSEEKSLSVVRVVCETVIQTNIQRRERSVRNCSASPTGLVCLKRNGLEPVCSAYSELDFDKKFQAEFSSGGNALFRRFAKGRVWDIRQRG